MPTDLRDRIAGSFYGLLVGDALGCPVEGLSQAQIARTYARITEMEEPRGRWRPRGLHSDDGQQAIAVCDAVLAAPDHPGPVFARLIVDLLRQGPRAAAFGLHRGTGGNFRRTVAALDTGAAWDQAASVSAGNGAAMRIAPIALYHRDDPAALLEGVVDVSRVTHRDPLGVAAAGALAFLVARAITHAGPARDLGDAAFLDFVRAIEDRCVAFFATTGNRRAFSDALGQVLADLDRPREALLERIEARAHQGATRRSGATSGYVLGSVITSIALFLTSQDYEPVLVDTIALGGDADTTGALVGQMAGALYGLAAIPERWRLALRAQGALEDRIDALLARQAGFQPAISVVELERPWTALLLAGREEGAPPS